MPIITTRNGTDAGRQPVESAERWTAAIPRRFIGLLGLSLAGANVLLIFASVLLAYIPGVDPFYQRLFNLDAEANLPAWFASLLWFLIALVAVLSYARDRAALPGQRNSRIWLFIACGFLYASLDEIAQIHESVLPQSSQILKYWLGTATLATRGTWLVLYVPLILLFAGIAGKFLLKRLKEPSSRLLFFTGVVFICLALFNEYVQWLVGYATFVPIQSGMDQMRVIQLISIPVEEACENFGAISILVAILSYSTRNFRIEFAD